MFGANVNIKKGKILIYRVFDIAHEVSLSKAEKILSLESKGQRLKLSKDPLQTIIIKEAPLTLQMGEEAFNVDSKPFKGAVSVKLWNYGALSVCLTVEVPENTPWKDLVSWGCAIDDSLEILKISENIKNLIQTKIESAISKKNTNVQVVEDFTTFLIEAIEDKDEQGQMVDIKDPQEVLKKVAVPELLLGEKEFTLAETTRKNILKDFIQYTKQDLAIVDWNSALIIDFSKQNLYQEYVDILEFSLTHLLELRMYDQLLDEKLSSLYDAIENKDKGFARSLMSNWFSQISKDAAKSYLEFSEFFENIDNSIKTVGNSYLASFFRETAKKYRFDDWKKNVEEKMSTLARISELLQGEVNSSKSHLMEIIIILLIAVEVVPLVFSWIKPYIMVALSWAM